MKHRHHTLMFLGYLVCTTVNAQTTTAEAYFNLASKEFVKVDKMQALRTLDKGLQQYPGDPRLLKLAEELLKEEENKQQQDQEQQEQQQKEQQEQQERDQQRQEQQEQDRQEEQRQEQEEQGEQQDRQQGAPKPGTIAPQDAMRMLDALERSEKDVQEKVHARRRPASRRTIQKDW